MLLSSEVINYTGLILLLIGGIFLLEAIIICAILLYGEIQDLPVNAVKRKAQIRSYTNIIERS